MRILYVEEHVESCELLALWLSGSGFEVVSANNMSDGLRLARDGTFAVYLLSGRFTDGTGLELCRAIRMFDLSTPIIFFSAFTRDCDMKAAMSAGAQAYLIKPDDLENIEPTIKRLVDASQTKRFSH